ncbi:hypothetical protein YC2023_056317 [Brassica napus]
MMIMVWSTLIGNHYKPISWKVFWSSPLNLLFMSAAVVMFDVQRTPHLPTQKELPFRIGFDGIEDGTCVMNCCKYNA